MDIRAIGDFTLEWGESLTWDDRRRRLYFIDYPSSRLCWLEDAAPPLHTRTLPSFPTGIALASDGRVVVAQDEGLFLVDPDTESRELLTTYPKALGRRVNDMTVDPAGNIVTGSLNIGARPGAGPAQGSFWQFSAVRGWRMLDDDICNANGPVCLPHDGGWVLVFADTGARKLYTYDYDPGTGEASPRSVFADIAHLGGYPDGACATAEGDVLSCILDRGVIAQYRDGNLRRLIGAGSARPTDLCLGGADLDRLFVVSIGPELSGAAGAARSDLAGRLVEIAGSGLSGLPEHRFALRA